MRLGYGRSCVAVMLLFGLVQAKSAYGQDINIEWKITPELTEKIAESLGAKPKPFMKSADQMQGLPLVYVIAAAISLPKVVDSVVEVYRNIAYGGILIDLRGGKIVIENNKMIPGGTIIVVNKDKVETISRDKLPDPTSALQALLKAQ